MAMLIGREREQALLRAAEEADRSQLVAVYGRLRVGKTFLIHESFRNGFAFQHTGMYGESRARQLAAFSHSLKDAGLAYDTPVPTNWFEAFQQLKSVINASTLQKKVVLLDELSWMDTPKSSTMQAFEYFWNSWASARNDVLLILCSSASPWMLDKVVHDTGGLYHRLNRQIHLRPSPLTWCKCYADANQLGLSDSHIVELYMVLGGIPAYWSLLQRGHSVSQSLDLPFFDTKAPLAREHDLLLASPFRRPEPYRKIVGALSRRKKGLIRSEILEATGIADTGAFSKQLEHLESCGLIRAYKAFGKRKKDSLFQLMDPSIPFHCRFLGSRPHDPHYWTHHLLHPAISSWRDLAFKQVCLLHVDEMKRKLGISGVFTKPSSFVCRADPELGTRFPDRPGALAGGSRDQPL